MEPTRLSEKLLDQYIKAGSSNTKLEELRVLAEHLCDPVLMYGLPLAVIIPAMRLF
jgi:hypothetical protein